MSIRDELLDNYAHMLVSAYHLLQGTDSSEPYEIDMMMSAAYKEVEGVINHIQDEYMFKDKEDEDDRPQSK